MKSVVAAFEKLYETGVKDLGDVGGPNPTGRPTKTMGELSKIMPSGMSFWNVDMVPSFADIQGQKSYYLGEESMPKIGTEQNFDEISTDICELFTIYNGQYLEYRVPKVWIDYQHKFNTTRRGSRGSIRRPLKANTTFTKNRATKMSMAIIKAHMKFKRLLLSARSNLKNSNYYRLSLKTHVQYVRFSDNTVMRVLVISDSRVMGYNQKKKAPIPEKKSFNYSSNVSLTPEDAQIPSTSSVHRPPYLKKMQNVSIPSISSSSIRSRESFSSLGA